MRRTFAEAGARAHRAYCTAARTQFARRRRGATYKMGMVGSVLRVCFGLTLAVFMTVDWLVCRLLLLCSCISERTRGGCALVSTQLAFTATLFLSPWVWITAEPGKDEVWAEIQKQLDSDDPRPIFLLGNHTSFMDTVLTVGERSRPRACHRSWNSAA